MGIRGVWRALLVITAVALVVTGSATAEDEARGIDPNQGRSLVEIELPSKAAAIQLQLDAEQYGVDFNDHYLRTNGNGTVTVTVFGGPDELTALEAAGYELGTTIEGPATWRERVQERVADVREEQKAEAAAVGAAAVTPADTGEIIVLRADLFENYAGRFLSVEAKTTEATVTGPEYTGPTLALTWNQGPGTA